MVEVGNLNTLNMAASERVPMGPNFSVLIPISARYRVHQHRLTTAQHFSSPESFYGWPGSLPLTNLILKLVTAKCVARQCASWKIASSIRHALGGYLGLALARLVESLLDLFDAIAGT